MTFGLNLYCAWLAFPTVSEGMMYRTVDFRYPTENLSRFNV